MKVESTQMLALDDALALIQLIAMARCGKKSFSVEFVASMDRLYALAMRPVVANKGEGICARVTMR